MIISAFITTKNANTRQDPLLECVESALNLVDELIIIDGGTTDGSLLELPASEKIQIFTKEWPEEFDWRLIGEQFQEGYQKCGGDWVIHLDCDYIFHQRDIRNIRYVLESNFNEPGVAFPKAQFILTDRYTVKSYVPAAVNKWLYEDKIRFDSGGDLCQPSLNGKELRHEYLPKSRWAIWNYDFSFKTQDVVAHEFNRFAKAWQSTFGNDPLGAESEEVALQRFNEMMLGRFKARDDKKIPLEDHPIMIQNKIRNMTKDHFGHSGWGQLPTAEYFNA